MAKVNKGNNKKNTSGQRKKSTKADQVQVRENIIKTALELAARDGWGRVTLESITQELNLPLADVRAHFKDRHEILRAYGDDVNNRVIENIGGVDGDANPRETLFDIIMERFDIMNENREGMIAILDHAKCDPKLIARTIPQLGQTIALILETAHIDTTGIKGIAHVIGLTGVYLLTLKTWRDDDSADMSKTMAALDRNLGRAEQLGTTLGVI